MRLSSLSFTFFSLFDYIMEIDCFDFHCGSCLGIGGWRFVGGFFCRLGVSRSLDLDRRIFDK